AINWSDPIIEDAVREALVKPQGDIFPEEVAEITSLNLYGLKIWDISSLALMPKLKKLNINKNGRPIVWSDPAIERAVRNVLGKPEGVIGLCEVQEIVRLPILDAVIEDISSLALMPKLKVLDFEDNSLASIDLREAGLIYEGEKPKPAVKADPEHLARQKALQQEALQALEDFEKADLKPATQPESEQPMTLEARRAAFRNLMQEVDETVAKIPKVDISKRAAPTPRPVKEKPAPLSEASLPSDFEDHKIKVNSTVEKALRSALQKPEGNIYYSDLILLTYLQINSAGLSDVEFLKYTPNLQYLDLAYNRISNIAPIAELTQLTELHLGLNEISDISPLANLPHLKHLELFSNRIEDISVLAGMQNLEKLTLRANKISNLAPLAQLSRLTWLSLENNQVESLEALAPLTQLQELYVNGNQITDLGVVANFTNLTNLDISKNPVSDASPLSGLTQLKELCIFDTKIRERKPPRALKNTEITR
ncbi:MAG: leucine-rich repeat domain-containing protein, partial [Clostridia bacterium]|nr:leucine-rich repeat domain-containing protein [Clostridia bacterium]